MQPKKWGGRSFHEPDNIPPALPHGHFAWRRLCSDRQRIHDGVRHITADQFRTTSEKFMIGWIFHDILHGKHAFGRRHPGRYHRDGCAGRGNRARCVKAAAQAPRMSIMISAIGVSYLLQNLATYLLPPFRAVPRNTVLKRIFQLGDVSQALSHS